MSENRTINIRPEGGTRDNAFAVMMQILGTIIWVVGVIVGIVLGVQTGRLTSYLGGFGFSWGTAIAAWSAAFVMGLIPFGFAEVISLLQRSVTLYYRMDPQEVSAEKQVLTGEMQAAEEKRVPIEKNEQEIPFRPQSLLLREKAGEMESALLLQPIDVYEVAGVLANMELLTVFGERYRMENVSFLEFQTEQDMQRSGFLRSEIPPRIAASVKSVRIAVKKYILPNEEKVYSPGEKPGKEKKEEENAPVDRREEFLNTASKMGSARELARYIEVLREKKHDPIVTPELNELVVRCVGKQVYEGKSYTAVLNELYAFFGKEMPDIPETPEPEKVHEQEKTQEPEQIEKAEETENNQGAQQRAAFSFCPKCGKRVDRQDSIFCAGCGAKLS